MKYFIEKGEELKEEQTKEKVNSPIPLQFSKR